MLKNCQLTDLDEKLDHLYVQLFMELNVIVTNVSAKKRFNKIKLGIKKNGVTKVHKWGSVVQKSPITFMYGSAPPKRLPAHCRTCCPISDWYILKMVLTAISIHIETFLTAFVIGMCLIFPRFKFTVLDCQLFWQALWTSKPARDEDAGIGIPGLSQW